MGLAQFPRFLGSLFSCFIVPFFIYCFLNRREFVLGFGDLYTVEGFMLYVFVA